MSWKNKLNQWRGETDEKKQKLAVTVAVVGTGLIFIIWLVIIAFDLSTPTPQPTAKKELVAVEVVSTDASSNQNSWWQSLSTSSGEAILSIWQGIKIITGQIAK